MTTEEIIKQTLSNMGEDVDDITMEELAADILGYINEGLRTLCIKYPIVTEQMVKPQEGFIPHSAFERPIVRILCIYTAAGGKINFETKPEGIFTSCSEELKVIYTTPPEDLVSLDEMPPLPPHTHSALADYATYRMLLRGGGESRNKAQAFYAHFMAVNNDAGLRFDSLTNKF